MYHLTLSYIILNFLVTLFKFLLENGSGILSLILEFEQSHLRDDRYTPPLLPLQSVAWKQSSVYVNNSWYLYLYSSHNIVMSFHIF